MRRSLLPAIATLLAGPATLLMITALPASAAPPPELPPPFGLNIVGGGGTFGEYEFGGTAFTYDTELVPEGSEGNVLSAAVPDLSATGTALQVRGLLPNRQYGAHAHMNSCGPTGEDAGAHFQYNPDPVSPSVDPAYANPDNEIWLDLTTDAEGNGRAQSDVDWTFGERRPGSVVIHETHTHTEAGQAGAAGERLACINVDF